MNNPASILFDIDGSQVGVADNPLRVDPTGDTVQPVSDGGGSLTVDVGASLPAGSNLIGAVRISDGVDLADVIDVDTVVVSGLKGLVTNAVIHGKSSAGGGTFVDVKVNPSGSLQVGGDVNVSDGGGSLTVDNAGTFAVQASQSGTWNIGNVSGTISLPTGAATESTLSTLNGKIPGLGQTNMAGSLPVTIASNQTAVPISDNGSSITVDNGGTFAVQAAQSGTWNINNISGTISLPTGAATETTLQSLIPKSIVDGGNSSSAALNAGQTFTGTGADVSTYSSVVVACKTDQPGMLYIEFSPDNSNWDSSLGFNIAADINEVHRLSITRRYFRVRFTNTSGSNQTYFRLQSMHGHQSALTSALNSSVQDDADSMVTRSVLMGQTDSGQWKFVPVTQEGHVEVALHDPRLPFGSIHTESLTPIFQVDAVCGLTTLEDAPGVSGSGSVTASDSSFNISTGTTIFSQAIMQSRKRLRYRPGQGSVGRFSAQFSAPANQSYQVVGFGHSEDGFYFGYKDTDFGILYVNRGVRATYTLTVTTGATSSGNATITLNGTAYTVALTNSSNVQRTVWEISQGTYSGWKTYPAATTVVFVRDSAGTTPGTFSYSAGTTGSAATIAQTKAGVTSTDTFIPQTTWNGDVLDGTGSTSNASGMLLDPSKYNVYQIKFQYLGAGVIIFEVEFSPPDGNNPIWVVVHTIRIPNTLTTTSVGNPTFPFTGAAYSAGSTTNLTIKIGSFAGFVEGVRRLHGPRFAYVDIATGTPSAFTPAFTIYNPRYFAGRSNQGVINVLGFGVGSKHGEALAVYLIRNGTLAGNPNFLSYSSNGMSLWDNASTAVTVTDNSQLLAAVVIGTNGTNYVPIGLDEEITLQPGEWLSVACRTAAANASNVQIILNTREDF